MESPLTTIAKNVLKKSKKPTSYSSDSPRQIKGILINREPPITSGWCGNDNCEHLTHKQRRAAQAAADKRAKK